MDVSDVTSESSDSTGYSSDEDPSRSSSHITPMIVVSNRCQDATNDQINVQYLKYLQGCPLY